MTTRRNVIRLAVTAALLAASTLVLPACNEDKKDDTPKTTSDKLKSDDTGTRKQGLEEAEKKYNK